VAKNTKQKRFPSSNSYSEGVSSQKHEHAIQSRYVVAGPEVFNMDDIAAMLDEDLYSHLNTMEDGRSKAYESRQDTRLWEEEIAYLRREIQLRRGRREAHEKYVAETSRSFADEERGLPAADFDNLKYVVSN